MLSCISFLPIWQEVGLASYKGVEGGVWSIGYTWATGRLVGGGGGEEGGGEIR